MIYKAAALPFRSLTMKILEYEDCPSLAEGSSRKQIVPTREYALVSDNNKKALHVILNRRQRQRGRTQHYQTATAWLPVRVMKDLFLPLGYPYSVRSEYLSYQIYDSLQGLCSYLRGVVSTSAVLTAAGVGNAEATAMSAAMTWAMRDGLGMIGGLMFSYSASSLFDSYVKEFRLFADIINDVGLTLDMLAPYAGTKYVLYVTSTATICKVMCGMAAGATKGSITQHLCLRGNMADLNAKENTQETLVSLIGMLLGIALARYLHHLEQDNLTMASAVSWTIFIVLTIIHVWANYEGVKVLHLRTLNRERATKALAGIIQQVAGESLWTTMPSSNPPSYNISSILTPEEISESLWASSCRIIFPGKIRLGARLSLTLSGLSCEEMLDRLQNEFGSENYVLGLVGRRGIVCVSLRVGATERTELKAFVHALVVHQCIKQGALVGKNDNTSRSQLISRTHEQVNNLFGKTNSTSKADVLSLDELEKKGWDCSNRLYFSYGRWRIHWSNSKLD